MRSSSAHNDPAPQVPENAKFRRERQHVVEEYWDAGQRQTARGFATGDMTYVREEDDDFVPDQWKLLNVVYGGHHSVNHFVVTDSQQRTISLTGNPKGYDALVEAADVRVESADDAIAAITFYLVRTRAHVFRTIVADADDLALDKAPVRDSEKEAVRNAREDARDIIAEPVAEQTDGGYRVTVYYQQNDTLRSWTGTVSANGALDGDSETHTTGLPVMFIE